MTKNEKQAAKAANIADLNEYTVLYLSIGRIKNDYYGNPRYQIKFLNPIGNFRYEGTIFTGLTTGRITKGGVTVQDHRGIGIAAKEFEKELRAAGVTVPVKWFTCVM